MSQRKEDLKKGIEDLKKAGELKHFSVMGEEWNEYVFPLESQTVAYLTLEAELKGIEETEKDFADWLDWHKLDDVSVFQSKIKQCPRYSPIYFRNLSVIK